MKWLEDFLPQNARHGRPLTRFTLNGWTWFSLQNPLAFIFHRKQIALTDSAERASFHLILQISARWLPTALAASRVHSPTCKRYWEATCRSSCRKCAALLAIRRFSLSCSSGWNCHSPYRMLNRTLNRTLDRTPYGMLNRRVKLSDALEEWNSTERSVYAQEPHRIESPWTPWMSLPPRAWP